MRVRPELANRLKAFGEGKPTTAPAQKGAFKAEIAGRVAPPAHPNWPHHTRQRQYKEITTDQATKLARHAPVIQECSRKYGVPVELVCAVILQESGGNPKAVSSAGAQGLMQLMPATARRFGVENSFDPSQNIAGGTKYLRFLLDRFKGDYRLAIAGYNAGEANVEKYGNKIPPFAETRAYVPKVLAYADTIYQILRTPIASPPLPSYARKV